MRFKHGFLFVCGAVFALAALFIVIGATTAQNVAPVNMSLYTGTISVTGNGYVYADPDLAGVSIGVTTEAATSTQAMNDNANAMSQVIAAVRALGIPDKDIKTSTVSLQPKYSYEYPTTVGATGASSAIAPALPTSAPTVLTTKIVGYTATNTVTVTIRDMSLVGPVIDAGYNGGANQVNGVTFLLSDEKSSQVYKQALQQAVADGSDKAKVMAAAAGIGDIKLKTLTESGSYYPIAYESFDRSAMASGAVAPTPISPGQNKVTATVTLTYVYVPQ